MDRPRYNTVVRRCALDRDFALFPHGDKTIVGERGVSLSGGKHKKLELSIPFDVERPKYMLAVFIRAYLSRAPITKRRVIISLFNVMFYNKNFNHP